MQDNLRGDRGSRGPQIRFGLLGGSGGEPWLGQITTITPPVANTLEEAVAHSSKKENRLSRLVLNKFRAYLANENPKKPYSDRQVIDYMSQQGYEITRSDIAYGRAIMESEKE